MGGGTETDERVDGERGTERRLAVLARQADVGVTVAWLAGLVEEAVEDLVLPGPQDDELAALGSDRVPAQLADEAAGTVAAVSRPW
jgi:hypothetical protein